jgi:hypothetical protein
MSKFGHVGVYHPATDSQVARAYCAGRTASYAAQAITTNPHPAGTPEYEAFRGGHVSYAAAGANTEYDGCDRPAKFNTPTLTIAIVAGDTTGATYQATPSAPGLPVTIGWGDGLFSNVPAGVVTAIQHKYEVSGTYQIRNYFLDKIRSTYSQAVTITPALRDAPLPA